MKKTPIVSLSAESAQHETEAVIIDHPATPARQEPQPPTRQQVLAAREEKCRLLTRLSRNLTSLRDSRDTLAGFKLDTSADFHGRNYAVIRITDDQNRIFETKNPVLIAMLADELARILDRKIEDVENEVLAVA
jgi:hypothetical protein